MNATVALLQNPDNEFGKAVQLKLVGIQQAAATTRALGEGPEDKVLNAFKEPFDTSHEYLVHACLSIGSVKTGF